MQDPNKIQRQDSFSLARLMKSLHEWVPLGSNLMFGTYGSQKAFVKTKSTLFKTKKLK